MPDELNELEGRVLELIGSRLAASPAEVAVELGIDLAVVEALCRELEAEGFFEAVRQQ